MSFTSPTIKPTELRITSLTQYSAFDIEGTFNFIFDALETPVNECNISGTEQSVQVTIATQSSENVTFQFDQQFPIEGFNGTGTVIDNHFSGQSTFDDNGFGQDLFPGCTVDGIFTFDLDIVGPGVFENGEATFNLSIVSGPCQFSVSPCESIFNLNIEN